MRKYMTRVWVVVCVGLMTMAGLGYAQPAGHSAADVPEGLDDLYPPKSPAPVFLLAMIEMSTSFSGIACNTLEGDMNHAKTSYEQFRAKYGEMAAMVPAWADNYPMEPVEQLGAAVAGGEPGAIMQALGKVGEYCHACHAATMPQVQWRYHWDDFGSITVADPLSGREVPFGEFKQMLQTNFTGIEVQLAEGQAAQAVQQLEGFEARFEAFKGVCENCHESERKYYVSEDIDALMKDLRNAVTAETVDAGAVQTAMQEIGQQSCSKCHRVHGPAALSRDEHQ